MRDPTVLSRSLENRIIPSYSFLKSVLHTNENFVAAITRSGWILHCNVEKNIVPNIEFLRGLRVPESRISFFVRTQPSSLVRRTDHFKEIIEKIMEMGFDPSKNNFLTAIHVFTGFNKSTWEQKSEVYRKWGWSEDEILSVFKRLPACMTASVSKIDRVMDFLVNKMGWDSSEVVACPLVIKYSLENWTKPRCLVVRELLSKGLIKKDFKLSYVIALSEKKFLDKFVTKYCTENPELLELYKEKVETQEFAT